MGNGNESNRKRLGLVRLRLVRSYMCVSWEILKNGRMESTLQHAQNNARQKGTEDATGEMQIDHVQFDISLV